MVTVPRVVKNAIRPAVISALTAWERVESGVSYDPTSDRIRNNPYDTYDRMRERDPVHRMRLINAWALTRL